MRKWQFSLLMVSLTVNLCESDQRIPCEVNLEEGVRYRKVSWYKVEDDSEQPTGLVIKNLQKNKTVLYRDVSPPYTIDDDLSLVIPETQKVCTTYICCAWPPLGHRIQEWKQNYPTGCQRPMKWQSQQVADEEEAQRVLAREGYAAKLFNSGSIDKQFHWLVGGLTCASVFIIAVVGVVYQWYTRRLSNNQNRSKAEPLL
ncbi:hypothetical protein AALO_G00055930 [Alosa alosa]|uniref:Uncharacterized protein n=1 Tax=Alosa alosa TaxID=278164 RepID=A0AAV6HAH5_9TELE|nr:hypothetical protein AALO_G00055930 [Alosa alosa]